MGASDERLVALARAGDEQAFAAIVERYRGPLLRYCRGFLPAAAAEDAVQQTFINAYGALTRDGPHAPVMLRPWLYRVAHNAALNVARDPQAGLEELPEGLDGVPRPDEVVQQRERFRRVVGAVSALPPKQRQVMVRHVLEGESHERIATDLGVSAGSIRQLVHRARRTVRRAAAAVLPTPLLRWLPWGPDIAEVAPAAGGGAALAKVAVAVIVAGAAGGGAVEVTKRDGDRRAVAQARKAEPARAPRRAPRIVAPSETLRPPVPAAGPARRPAPRRSSSGSSGSGSSGSSGSGSSGSSGSGSSGSSDSSGSGSSGTSETTSPDSSGSSGSDSSGSGSDSSGSGSSGSGSDSSGSGSSGSSGSGSSGSGSDSSGPGSGSPTAEPVLLDSSGSGSSGTLETDSSGSGSGSSGSSGSGSGSDDD